jgi:HNH endonuclease/NUMOD4 motif
MRYKGGPDRAANATTAPTTNVLRRNAMADRTISHLVEEWRPIEDYPGYEVSSFGRVRSLERIVVQRSGKKQPQPARLLSFGKMNNGYKCVSIRTPGRRDKVNVHVLVTRAFLGPRPKGQESRHKDGDRMNARLDNLSYGTRKQNIADAIAHGTFGRLKKNRKIESQRDPLTGKFRAGPAVPAPIG